jgi:hypothetical protein
MIQYEAHQWVQSSTMNVCTTSSVEVLGESVIPVSQVSKNLSQFLKKKHIQEGMSDDDYTRLERVQKALEKESDLNAESASS